MICFAITTAASSYSQQEFYIGNITKIDMEGKGNGQPCLLDYKISERNITC